MYPCIVRGTFPNLFFSATILPQTQMPWHDSYKMYEGFVNLARNALNIDNVDVGASMFSNPLHILQLSCQGICALGKIVALNTKDFGKVHLTRG
jgi:hypothetical protein